MYALTAALWTLTALLTAAPSALDENVLGGAENAAPESDAGTSSDQKWRRLSRARNSPLERRSSIDFAWVGSLVQRVGADGGSAPVHWLVGGRLGVERPVVGLIRAGVDVGLHQGVVAEQIWNAVSAVRLHSVGETRIRLGFDIVRGAFHLTPYAFAGVTLEQRLALISAHDDRKLSTALAFGARTGGALRFELRPFFALGEVSLGLDGFRPVSTGSVAVGTRF